MAEATKDERAKRARAHVPASDVPDPAASDGSHVQGGCPVAWCPICMAVTAVQPLKPEVIEHLLKAGTEMLLAFRGVIDARAEEMHPTEGEQRHSASVKVAETRSDLDLLRLARGTSIQGPRIGRRVRRAERVPQLQIGAERPPPIHPAPVG